MLSETLRVIQLGDVYCTSHDYDDVVAEVRFLLEEPIATPRTLTYMNAHVYCLARKDEILRRALTTSRVVAADGVSMSLASTLLEGMYQRRCIMTKAFDAYLATSDMPESRAVMVGTSLEEANQAASAINAASEHLKIIQTFSGFHYEQEYLIGLRRFRNVDMVLIGMGSPRSERVIDLLARGRISAVLWHIGAGTIKCYAGTKHRAPELISRLGLEWAHRFAFEPHIRRRCLLGIPEFAWVLVQSAMRKRLQRHLGHL